MADYGSYSQGQSYGYGYGGGGQAISGNGTSAVAPQAVMRRRQLDPVSGGYNNGSSYYGGGSAGASSKYSSALPRKNMVKKLDFMFPKVDTEYTVRTDSGGMASLMAYCLIAVLAMAEFWSWSAHNQRTIEHVKVDTSMGKRMRVNLNITFPGLACEDLHVDIMDIAGDSQLDVEDTLKKRRLNRRGLPMGDHEILKINKHRAEQEERKLILQKEVPEDYCGPCYGADPPEGKECCDTCDEIVEAYKKRRWRHDALLVNAEQCIREGKDKLQPKRIRHGEGCNLHGYFNINRVGGNFHIAMGEGVERDGRHIHTFNPDDTHSFNASHIIHHLSFGPEFDFEGMSATSQHKQLVDQHHPEVDRTSLNGVTKIVDKSVGTTGLFQYFIKIVPTTYISNDQKTVVETNRYFFTERFRPLMKEYLEDDEYFADTAIEDDYAYVDDDIEGENKGPNHRSEEEKERNKKKREEKKKMAASKAISGHSNKHEHHDVKNSVLPGIFFIYEIYPFSVEVRTNNVSKTHLWIRLMATVGGVFTILKWADSFLFSRRESSRNSAFR